jgi:hypothetical protein
VPSVKLTAQELDSALAFVREHGASELFPHPTELQALEAYWDKVRPVLESVDLLSYEPRPAFELIAPKARYTVRPAHLLDPVDTLLLAGLLARLAPAIEDARPPLSAGTVFSFRVSRETERPFFLRTDFDGYQKKLREKTRAAEFVGSADIVDFFPRIYLHRLHNAVDAITRQTYETRALMRLLDGWSHGTSYGIPTGPTVSNLLAEALLVEVDEYLGSHQVDFIRNVDDYFIFGDTAAECRRSLFLLGSRLHESQGLSLNMAKTGVMSTQQFRTEVLRAEDPDVALRNKIRSEVFHGDPYAEVDYDELTDKQKELVDEMDARRMLEKALETDAVDLSAVRFVLNLLTAFKRPDLVDPVLENLDRLAPVSNAVARFLNVFDQVESTDRVHIGQRLLDYARRAEFVSDYQIVWLLEPFTQSEKWDNLTDLRVIARDNANEFVRRQAILGLGQIGDRSALLDQKGRYDAARDWEQRAILFACRKLPPDERDALYRQLRVSGAWTIGNLVTKALVPYSRT